jgi:hypothetical protein
MNLPELLLYATLYSVAATGAAGYAFGKLSGRR